MTGNLCLILNCGNTNDAVRLHPCFFLWGCIWGFLLSQGMLSFTDLQGAYFLYLNISEGVTHVTGQMAVGMSFHRQNIKPCIDIRRTGVSGLEAILRDVSGMIFEPEEPNSRRAIGRRQRVLHTSVSRELTALSSFMTSFFLGLLLWHMEDPGLVVESELQLLPYTTAMATPDLSHICNLTPQLVTVPDP